MVAFVQAVYRHSEEVLQSHSESDCQYDYAKDEVKIREVCLEASCWSICQFEVSPTRLPVAEMRAQLGRW